MRTRLGPTQELTAVQAANGARPTLKEIPYDYVATFTLTGTAGTRVQDVINTSVDGAFVAVAIGYSFIPARLPEITSEDEMPTPQSSISTLDRLLASGVPAVLEDPRILMQCLMVRLCGIEFKYSIIDSAVGRELQNKPIHNIAGLGEVNGRRPFRPMAKPMLFMPRSTIRIEIEEISAGPLYTGAELQIVLHGYKILGYGTG
jgi:hypothetical protein